MNYLKTLVAGFCLVALHTFAHPCLSDKAMKCNATAQATTIMLAMYLIMQLACILRERGAFSAVKLDVSKSLFDVLIPAGILVATKLIGLCKMADMICQQVMRPVLWCCCGALLGLGIVSFIIDRRTANAKAESV